MYKDSLAQLPPQQIYRQKTHWLNVDLTGIIDIRPTGSVLNKKAHWLGADLTRTLDRRPTGVGQISLDFSTKDPLAQFRSQQNYQQKTQWLGGDLVGTMDKTHLLSSDSNGPIDKNRHISLELSKTYPLAQFRSQ